MNEAIVRQVSLSISKNKQGWFEDEYGKVFYHFAEIKAGSYQLPCKTELNGGDIIFYDSEIIEEMEFDKEKTFGVSGAKFGSSSKITLIPLGIIEFNENQKKSFSVLHQHFPKDFFSR